MAAIWRRQARHAVARGKDKRNVAGSQRIGDRIALFAIDIYIQNGNVDGLALGHLDRLFEVRDRAHNKVSEVNEHVLEQQPDQAFVLDQQNAQPLNRTARLLARRHGLLLGCKGWRFDHTNQGACTAIDANLADYPNRRAQQMIAAIVPADVTFAANEPEAAVAAAEQPGFPVALKLDCTAAADRFGAHIALYCAGAIMTD